MIIKDSDQLETYKQAGLLSTQILEQLGLALKEGSTSQKVDNLAFELCKKNSVVPSFFGVESGNRVYQYASCISVNDQILHALPNSRPFEYGDIVKIDFGIVYKGFFTDHCYTFVVGGYKDAKDEALVAASNAATLASIPKAKVGNRVGDLGFVMRKTANELGFEIVRDFVGHGIGMSLHDLPIINPYAKENTGEVLVEGLVLCLECQVTKGDGSYKVGPDGWTIVSPQGYKAGMVEYMVIVGQESPLILTPTDNWQPIID